ncbi:MAG: glycoside hydrolase family 31 protein [Clostridiales bacterium]|jgi:alpha-D-xyloside xylohydrolase|nr:glycoside hydrolase family 31 protein [Clostridiales bacterium]
MGFFEQVGNRLVGKLHNETIWIIPWGKDSLRVITSMMSDPQMNDWALLPQSDTDYSLKIEDMKASITVRKITAVAEVCGWNKRIDIKFYNDKGELLLAEKEFQGAVNRRGRFFKPTIGGDYRLTVTFEGDQQEKLFGMGQYQEEILNINGSSFELAHRNSQASVPFVLSNKGYGFLWHNPAIGKATFTKNGMEWISESTKQVDYWITVGDSPAEIGKNYSAATGRAPEMPEYGLGYWQCKLRYWNQEQLLETAREYKKRGIPVDVIVCDFFHWPHMGDFRFDEEFFPDPKSMVDELREMGMELMVSIWTQVGFDSENYQEMNEKGLLIKAETGLQTAAYFFNTNATFLDATNPEARKYVWEKCKKNYYKHGIKVFWLDEAEPDLGTYDFENYRFYSGTQLQTGNIYPQMFSRLFYDGMKSENQETVMNLVRCAWAGSQRYGALVWSGDIHSDFATFKRQICAGLSMGIAGIPWWTTDIGGFSGGDPKDPAFQELLVRWFQWGAFCPVMRMHGDRLPSAEVIRKDGSNALDTGGDNEVWDYGDENYEIMVKYINLREKMRDYTRKTAKEASDTGAPMMRTMFFEFPDEEICWELQDQYMFGSDILVAPVTEAGASSRKVYLPKATEWTDMRNGKEYEGGQEIIVEAPIEYMPVFFKNHSHPELVGIV